MEIKITSWRTAAILFSEEQESLKRAVEKAVKDRMDLSSADLSSANLSSADLSSANLRYADLSSADLSSANLRYADLRYADLSSANLRSANLSSADLSSANLRSADLRSADLRYANLSSANLSSANLNWESHTLLAEILQRAASSNVPKRMVAGLILITPGWCWRDFLRLDHEEKAWALMELGKYGTEKSPIPGLLKKAIEQLTPKAPIPS